MNQQRHRLLLQGLVGDEHAEQFATDPWFGQSIEMFARMLPPMIDGLAAAHKAASALRSDAMDRLRRGLDLPEDLILHSGASPWEQIREADELLGAHLQESAQRLGLCLCPDPERAVDPRCSFHGLAAQEGSDGV